MAARLLMMAAALGLTVLVGCARGGEGEEQQSQSVLEIYVQFAGPVDETAYYFFALDTDGDWGGDYPVPVAAGPFWGNGWGTGSITHYILYHLGRYEVYQATRTPVLRNPGAGISAVSGIMPGGDCGRYSLTVGGITYGEASLSGAGMIQSVVNETGQNAGTITVETNSAGEVVAGSVTFTLAEDGGRPPNAAEAAALAALNGAGVPLRAESLQAFGLRLTLGPPGAGSQSITIAPSVGLVSARFVPIAAGAARNFAATLTANSSTPTSTPPVEGAVITTGDLIVGGQADVDVEMSQSGRAMGPPFAYTLPAGRNVLRASVDLNDLGANLSNISINVITTTELIFDPSITDPDLHCYDGFGPLGNDALTIKTSDYGTYRNGQNLVREEANDRTLAGRVTEQQRKAVDIVDWSISVQRLR